MNPTPIVLTHNQLAFLQGLLDRPRGVALSRRDLVAAATPYIIQLRSGFSYSCLYKAVREAHLPASGERSRPAAPPP